MMRAWAAPAGGALAIRSTGPPERDRVDCPSECRAVGNIFQIAPPPAPPSSIEEPPCQHTDFRGSPLTTERYMHSRERLASLATKARLGTTSRSESHVPTTSSFLVPKMS